MESKQERTVKPSADLLELLGDDWELLGHPEKASDTAIAFLNKAATLPAEDLEHLAAMLKGSN